MASQMSRSGGSTNPMKQLDLAPSLLQALLPALSNTIKYLPFSAIMFHKRCGSCFYYLQEDLFSVGTLNFLLSGKWSACFWGLLVLYVRNHPMAGTPKHRTSIWGVQDAPKTLNNWTGLLLLGLGALKKFARNLQVPKLISGFLQQWKSK